VHGIAGLCGNTAIQGKLRTLNQSLNTRLRIWGSEVRILSGAPDTAVSRRIMPKHRCTYDSAVESAIDCGLAVRSACVGGRNAPILVVHYRAWRSLKRSFIHMTLRRRLSLGGYRHRAEARGRCPGRADRNQRVRAGGAPGTRARWRNGAPSPLQRDKISVSWLRSPGRSCPDNTGAFALS
jgi:hypothetical protein